MTTISLSLASDAAAAPRFRTRNPSLDRTRTFLTLAVLLQHAVIPYTYFGHTDPKSWIGFDVVVLATDSFFMAMFFFVGSFPSTCYPRASSARQQSARQLTNP